MNCPGGAGSDTFKCGETHSHAEQSSGGPKSRDCIQGNFPSIFSGRELMMKAQSGIFLSFSFDFHSCPQLSALVYRQCGRSVAWH